MENVLQARQVGVLGPVVLQEVVMIWCKKDGYPGAIIQ